MDENGRDEDGRAAGQQRGSIPSFLLGMIILFLLTNHNGEEFLARHQYQDGLRSLTWQLGNFSRWLNGTDSNFTMPERDSTVLPLVHSIIPIGESLDPYEGSYYPNITGVHHGDSHFLNISDAALPELNSSIPWKDVAASFITSANGTNLTEALGRIGTWNWKESDQVSLNIAEKPPHPSVNITEKLALVHGRIELTDSSTSEELRLEFEAVHFTKNGSIYGFAEPNPRNIDIRLLPSLVPEEFQNQTAAMIEPELVARIKKLTNLIDAGVIESDTVLLDEKPATTCPFLVYGQLTRTTVPEELMQELEIEIQTPTGLSTVRPPKLSMDFVLLSKECGILFEILKTDGLRSTSFFRKVTNYSGLAAFLYFTMVIILFKQLGISRTPSGVSRVSRWTFFIQSTLDSVSFAGHVTFAILSNGRPSVSLVAPAFLACILFFYEAQFSVLIFQVQAPEDAAPAPLPPPPAPTSANTAPSMPQRSAATPTPPGSAAPPPAPPQQQPTATLPAPVTQPTQTATNPSPNSSFWRFFLHHVRTDPQARLWMFFFVFMTFVVRVIMSPTLSLIFIWVTYSGIWLPQIFRSVRKQRSSGLTKEYVIGTTVCRLFFVLYFLGCPGNVLDVNPRPWVYFLALFVTIQAGIVLLQDLLGPTFFLPKQYSKTKTYDYHPALPLPDPEAPEQSLGDCSICMDAILVEDARRRSMASTRGDREEKHPLLQEDEHWEAQASATPATATFSEMKRKSAGVVDSATGGFFTKMQMGVGNAVTRKSYSLAPCHHLFHTECLERWLEIKTICPQCRRPLPPL